MVPLVILVAALAGCSGSPRPEPAPRPAETGATTTRQPPAAPALTESICARALGFDGAVEIAALGASRSACLGQRVADQSREIALIAFELRAAAWVEVGRFDVEVAEVTGDETSKSGEASLSTERIAPSVTAAVLEVSERENGPAHSDVKTATIFFVASADSLDEILRLESESSTGEADDITEVSYAISDAVTGGHFDIEVTTKTSTVQWAAGETEPVESTEETIYRWTGSEYAEGAAP